MNYIDTDVLMHSLVNHNPNLHAKANDLIEGMLNEKTFLMSWLNIEEAGFVLGKLNQPADFISSRLRVLMSSVPADYGLIEFTRAVELAKIIGYRDFNDCLHTAIAEQRCKNLYTCNIKDFKRIQPHTSLQIHF